MAHLPDGIPMNDDNYGYCPECGMSKCICDELEAQHYEHLAQIELAEMYRSEFEGTYGESLDEFLSRA